MVTARDQALVWDDACTNRPAVTAPARRTLGFGTCLALVVGNLIGSGIYLLPASLAPLGWNGMAGWAISIVGGLSLAHVFARLSAHLPASGGPYAYARAAFGPGPAFVVAWSYWVMLWGGNGGVAIAVVSALSLVVPGLGATPGLAGLLAIALVWVVTAINISGVTAAGRVQVVTLLLKLVPLVAVPLIALGLLVERGSAALLPAAPVPISLDGIAMAAALTFWGFLGLESATIPAGHFENPRRNIPLATMVGTVLTGFVYILVSLTIMLLMPHAQTAASPAPIAAFIGNHLGATAAGAVALFAAISAFGTLNGFVLVQGEMPWAMAMGGVFPRWLARTSARGTPARAHIVSSLLLSAVMLSNFTRSMGDLFTFIALISIAAGLVAYFVCALAAIKLLHRERLVWLSGGLASGFALWTLYGCGLVAMAWALGLVLAGLPIYLWVRLAERDPPGGPPERSAE
jgi:basic amino acid/polyamine antiporter, APA family